MLALGLFLAGSGSTILSKLQDQTYTLIDGVDIKWHHPFFQTTVMFVGESLCFLPYLILIKKDFMNNYPIDKLPLNQFKILIPTLCDLIGSTTVFFGLT